MDGNYRRINFQSCYDASHSRLHTVLSYRVPTTQFFMDSLFLLFTNFTVVNKARTDVLRKSIITDVCNTLFVAPRKTLVLIFSFLSQNRIWDGMLVDDEIKLGFGSLLFLRQQLL